MMYPLIGMPQGAEWIVILAIVILVFGAAKLPDLARSTGQALKIFKSETKGLIDSDDDKGGKKDGSTAEAQAPVAGELPPGSSTSGPVEGTTGSAQTGDVSASSTERHPG